MFSPLVNRSNQVGRISAISSTRAGARTHRARTALSTARVDAWQIAVPARAGRNETSRRITAQ